jgi:hypothetical protein
MSSDRWVQVENVNHLLFIPHIDVCSLILILWDKYLKLCWLSMIGLSTVLCWLLL